jgi:hypothetical protein
LTTWPSVSRRNLEVTCPSGSSKAWPIAEWFIHTHVVGRNLISVAGTRYIRDLGQAHIDDTYRNYSDRASFLSENTIYGDGYPWGYARATGGAGVIEMADSFGFDSDMRNFCRDVGECPATTSCTAVITAETNAHRPNAICNRYEPPVINVISCCPGKTDLKSDGTYKNCTMRPQADPGNYIHYMVDGFDFSKMEGFNPYDYPDIRPYMLPDAYD